MLRAWSRGQSMTGSTTGVTGCSLRLTMAGVAMVPSRTRQPKLRPTDPAGMTLTSSRSFWPTSPIHRSRVTGSKAQRHGLRRPKASSKDGFPPTTMFPAGTA